MWLAPLALAGLAAVALPLLVHWLARHEAARRVFPTVRFLPRTPPTSVRRHRLTDLALLALRIAIVAAAAAALAQPALVTPPAPGGRPAQAVVIDSSASMLRTLADGRTGASAADAALAALDVQPGDDAVVIRTADLRDGVVQAGAWLRTQPRVGEVTVISDFQVGALVEADLDALPVTAGRRFVRVRVHGAAAAEAAARAVVSSEAISDEIASELTTPTIVIAFEGAPEFADLQATATPITTPAMYNIARRVDPEMTSGVFSGALVDSEKTPDVISELIVLSTLPPDSVEAAALIARALRVAAESPVPLAEREPDVLAAEVIDAWQRDPRPGDVPRSGEPAPFGRWLWALVLVLLAVETWVRRTRPTAIVPTRTEEDAHARVA